MFAESHRLCSSLAEADARTFCIRFALKGAQLGAFFVFGPLKDCAPRCFLAMLTSWYFLWYFLPILVGLLRASMSTLTMIELV